MNFCVQKLNKNKRKLAKLRDLQGYTAIFIIY